MKIHAIVLAAGKGTRMKTDLPKCAFPILKKPMIEYIIENIERSMVEEIICVIGHKKELMKEIIGKRVKYAYQDVQFGTGHAVIATKDILATKEGTTIILLGDMPLVDYKLINKVISHHLDRGNDLTVVTTKPDNPKGYGRIVRNEFGNIESIVEQNDCNQEQRRIREINTGMYVASNKVLFKALEKVVPNEKTGEYYLTDIVEIMKKDYVIGTILLWDSPKVIGVNNLFSISIAEKNLRERINKHHMLNGVSIINPETVTIGYNVLIEGGVVINPNSYITGNSVIKAGAIIGPNTEIDSSIIHENVKVKHSLVYDSVVNSGTVVGPFAHLRNKAVIGKNNRVGNFVEVKNSSTGNGTKAAHLAYIGDTRTGDNVNFGCGSITVNYDGVKKHQTIIGDDVFIGCNTNLIAPLEIGNQVFIAAGSTVTKNIPSGAFAIARNKQINKTDYAKNLIRPKDDN